MLEIGTENRTDVMEKIITSTSLVIVDGNVVKTYTNPDVEFSDDSADENFEAVWPLIKDKKVYNLIVADPSTHVTVEAREYMNEKFETIKIGEAIVIKTLGHRILAQFYQKIRKHRYPIRIFDSESKAMDWFKELERGESA